MHPLFSLLLCESHMAKALFKFEENKNSIRIKCLVGHDVVSTTKFFSLIFIYCSAHFRSHVEEAGGRDECGWQYRFVHGLKLFHKLMWRGIDSSEGMNTVCCRKVLVITQLILVVHFCCSLSVRLLIVWLPLIWWLLSW